MKEPRVVIAIPLATPLIYWKTVAAVLAMEKPDETDLMVFQGALVDRARNILIERMFEHSIEPTHIFFLDADILPAPDTLTKLLKAKKPMISGVYRRRLPPHEPMAFTWEKKKLKPVSMKGKALKKVDVVGAGCLLIQRVVLEEIRGPWFTSEWTEGGHLAEDFSFCEKVRKSGQEIYVDTSVTPLHIEPMGVGTSKDGGVSFVMLHS